MVVYKKTLQHAKQLQKQVHNKETKLKSYVFYEKIWLNSKYIKIKYNQKLKVKFFRFFQVLYSVDSQVYKLELLKY